MSNELITALQSAAGNAGSFYPYTVDYSCRFNDGDSPYLTRTQATPTSAGVWTFSTWIKLVSPSDSAEIFASGPNVSNYERVTFTGSTSTFYWDKTQSGIQRDLLGNANVSHRDPSGWLHLLVRKNGTTASEIIVNGVSLDTHTPSAFTNYMNVASTEQNIGRLTASYPNNYGDYYLSQVAFVDGQYLDYDDFTEFKNGVLCPSDLSGITWGNNGFLLDFGNSAALGTDVSGNANNFTSSGLTSSDQVTDTPSNNFATLNALLTTSISDGNLYHTYISGTYDSAVSTLSVTSGKWYAECTITKNGTYPGFGIVEADAAIATNPSNVNYIGSTNGGGYGFYPGLGWYRNQTLLQSNTTSISTGSVIGLALDLDSSPRTIKVYDDGTLIDTLSNIDLPSAGYIFGTSIYTGNSSAAGRWNFGQTAFVHTPPTDHLALSTANLPEPTIGPNSDIKPEDCFATVLYTGNGTAIGSGGKVITGVGFQPDMVWIKNRDAADSWMVFDSVRGATKYLSLNSTADEATSTESLTSFDADGFTLGNQNAVNTNTENYVAYCFKITAGFFDIQNNLGTGVAKTVAHDLGVVPAFIINKAYDRGTGSNWPVYCEAWPVPDPETDNQILNGTLAIIDDSTMWNDTAPTSSVFSVGTNVTNLNGVNSIVYLFANVPNFCKIGYYEGNGSADGAFQYLGFSPILHINKRTDAAASWNIYDTKRSPYNPMDKQLFLDSPNVENTTSGGIKDALSNGVKLRGTGSTTNASGGDYITLSIGTSSKYSNAR